MNTEESFLWQLQSTPPRTGGVHVAINSDPCDLLKSYRRTHSIFLICQNDGQPWELFIIVFGHWQKILGYRDPCSTHTTTEAQFVLSRMITAMFQTVFNTLFLTFISTVKWGENKLRLLVNNGENAVIFKALAANNVGIMSFEDKRRGKKPIKGTFFLVDYILQPTELQKPQMDQICHRY